MNSFYLKLLALITMIIDHVGAVIFPNILWLRYIGRIAFPIYAYLVSEGCKKTKNFKLYLKRLFIFAIISEIFYDLCFNNKNLNFLNHTNTIYTLFLASFSIYLFKITQNNILKFSSLFMGIFISYILKSDYGYFGVILIYLAYFIKNKKLLLICSMLWVTIKNMPNLYIILYYLLSNNIKYLNPRYINQSLCIYIFTIISLFILYFYNGKKGKNLKWTFYIAYPLHLFLIYIISII